MDDMRAGERKYRLPGSVGGGRDTQIDNAAVGFSDSLLPSFVHVDPDGIPEVFQIKYPYK